MDTNPKTKVNIRKDLVYKELCYQIVGVLFDVYKELGHGHPEKTYQRAVAVLLEKRKYKFVEQLYSPVIFEGKVVGKNYMDFLIEDKVVLEIKKGDYFIPSDIDQVNKYLVAKNLQLGILAYFAPRTVHWKRIVNLS
jgi:GxxExxY protein